MSSRLVLRSHASGRALVLGMALLMASHAVFYTLHYGIAIVYYRGLTMAMLVLSTIAGAGLMEIRRLRAPRQLAARLRRPRAVGHFGNGLALVAVVVVLAVAIPSRHNIGYYHMIDDEDYEAFTWIAANVGASYQKAVLDPWKATAFAALTGRHVYTRLQEFPKPPDSEALDFLSGGAADTEFLRENGISIVYSAGIVNNPDLEKVAESVYLLRNSSPVE